MEKYKVKIIETLSREIEVDASDMDEAYEIANYLFKSNKLNLGEDDFEERKIYVLGNGNQNK